MDPGGFGGVTITKSITIDGSPGNIAGVLVASTNAIIINGAGAVVTLRNLDIEGLGFTGSPGINGINFLSGAGLHVQNLSIRGFHADPDTSAGIAFKPSTTANLFVKDTVISGSVRGILIKPTGSGAVKASIARVNLENNLTGIRADTSGGTATVAVTVSDSVVSGNTNAGMTAFTAPAGGVASTVMVTRSTITNNGNGLNANGNAAIMRFGSSVISGNTGAPVLISNSATLTSYGNNQVDDNGSVVVIATSPLK